MGCHYKCLIYTRMLFYISIIAIHGANTVVLLTSFTEESLKIQGVRDFHETQFFFFTCWNFAFQMAYAAYALFCDWTSLHNTSEKKQALPESITNFRDKVFTVAVFPGSLMVTTYFWGFYAYDRNLLYPEYFDTVVTPLSNHIMHTFPIVVVLLELVLYPRRKPENSVWRVLCVLGIEAVYVSTLYFVHFWKGIWIYPIFAKLNQWPVGLSTFLLTTGLYLTVLYYLQFCVSTFVLKCRDKIGEKLCGACKK